MPEEQLPKAARLARARPHTLILWLLFLGLVVSLGANIRQDLHIESLAVDLATLRQESQRQIAALRDAQSTTLEQDLLRLDQLTTQLQTANEDDRKQVAATAIKMRSELASTVEQRHQEMIAAISDLRADLRSAANPKTSQTNELEKPHTEAPWVGDQVSPPATNGIDNAALLAASVSDRKLSEEQTSEQSSQPTAPKKRFWNKLNPFSRNKNKQQETATGGPAQ